MLLTVTKKMKGDIKMPYRRNYRNYSKPVVRNITVRYAGDCVCCGAPIAAGSIATFYPAGTIAGIHEGKISHIGGLEGTGTTCAHNLKLSLTDRGLNDYAGDGMDARYEDDCARICGI